MTSAHRRRPLLVLWMTLLFAAPLGAGQVRPLNLEEMTRRAERIFAGRCVAVETLFLYPESRLGLTSPVGLGQGKLSILRDKQGQDVAWEGRRALPLAALLDGIRSLARDGPVGADEDRP